MLAVRYSSLQDSSNNRGDYECYKERGWIGKMGDYGLRRQRNQLSYQNEVTLETYPEDALRF